MFFPARSGAVPCVASNRPTLAVTLDERNDRLIRDAERKIRFDLDLCPCLGHCNVLVDHKAVLSDEAAAECCILQPAVNRVSAWTGVFRGIVLRTAPFARKIYAMPWARKRYGITIRELDYQSGRPMAL
jgi:hypothetical protein